MPHPVSIADLLSGKEIDDGLVLARDRVIFAFISFRVFSRGKMRRTDGYIVGVGPRQKDLAAYVAEVCRHKKRHFVHARQIQHKLDVGGRLARQIANQIEKDLIAAVIEEMCSPRPPACEVWYDEGGYWNVLPSTLDSHRALRRAGKRLRRGVKRDDRSFHGRHREQSKRAGGHTSVGHPRA